MFLVHTYLYLSVPNKYTESFLQIYWKLKIKSLKAPAAEKWFDPDAAGPTR